MDEKLKDIGARMDLGDEDIKRIERRKKWEPLLIICTGMMITVFSIFFGRVIGDLSYEQPEYPYYIGLMASRVSFAQRNKQVLIVVSILTLIFSILFFIIGMKSMDPDYQSAPMYGCYSR